MGIANLEWYNNKTLLCLSEHFIFTPIIEKSHLNKCTKEAVGWDTVHSVGIWLPCCPQTVAQEGSDRLREASTFLPSDRMNISWAL
jgi:hypothetical protein